MCYNCGCFIPEDDMGHPDNITDTTFKHLGDHIGKSEKEAKELVYSYLLGNKVTDQEEKEIISTFEKAMQAWGQSMDEAKKNTLDLLKDQLGK